LGAAGFDEEKQEKSNRRFQGFSGRLKRDLEKVISKEKGHHRHLEKALFCERWP
jgi:hypothetical protein